MLTINRTSSGHPIASRGADLEAIRRRQAIKDYSLELQKEEDEEATQEGEEEEKKEEGDENNNKGDSNNDTTGLIKKEAESKPSGVQISEPDKPSARLAHRVRRPAIVRKAPTAPSKPANLYNMSTSIMTLPSHMAGFLHEIGPPASGVYR